MKKLLGILAAVIVVGLIAASPQGNWITIFGTHVGWYDTSDNALVDIEAADKSLKVYGPIDANGLLRANAAASVTGTLTLSGTTSNIALGSNYLSSDGGDEGISVFANGNTLVSNLLLMTPKEVQQAITASDAAAGDSFGGSACCSADGSRLFIGAQTWEGSYKDQGAVYVFGPSTETVSHTRYTRRAGWVQSSTSELKAMIDGAAKFVITATNAVASGQIRGTSIYASTGMQSPHYTVASIASLKDNIRSATDGTKITKFVRQPVPVLRIFNWNNPVPPPSQKDFKSYTIMPENNPLDKTKVETKGVAEPIEVTAEEQYQKALSSWQQLDNDPFYQRDRLGFIVEELPLKYLADDQKGWDMSTFVVEHEGKLQQLFARVEKLEGER